MPPQEINGDAPSQVTQSRRASRRAINPVTGAEASIPEGFADNEEDASVQLASRMSKENHNEWVRTEDLNRPKFGTYALPGGENYREMLLTLNPRGKPLSRQELLELEGLKKKVMDDRMSVTDPRFADLWARYQERGGNPAEQARTFKSPHWGRAQRRRPCTVHSTRTGPNGEKLLHVEELQSDWHQKGDGRRATSPNPEIRRAQLEATQRRVEVLAARPAPRKSRRWVAAMNVSCSQRTRAEFPTRRSKRPGQNCS